MKGKMLRSSRFSPASGARHSRSDGKAGLIRPHSASTSHHGPLRLPQEQRCIKPLPVWESLFCQRCLVFQHKLSLSAIGERHADQRSGTYQRDGVKAIIPINGAVSRESPIQNRID